MQDESGQQGSVLDVGVARAGLIEHGLGGLVVLAPDFGADRPKETLAAGLRLLQMADDLLFQLVHRVLRFRAAPDKVEIQAVRLPAFTALSDQSTNGDIVVLLTAHYSSTSRSISSSATG